MRNTILSLSLILSLSYAASVISIPSGASWSQPEGAYLQVDEITVAAGGTFIAADPGDVSVTPTGEGDISLPVTLVYFKACPDEENGTVILSWLTASETDNLGFIIERAMVNNESDEPQWTEIASYITATELQGQGSVTHSTMYNYKDQLVEALKTYDYRLADVSFTGARSYYQQYVMRIRVPEILPKEYCLKQNYPNPFNPSTVIRYGLPEQSDVILVIYDLRGRIISTLAAGRQEAGFYDYTWNGLDETGRPVSAGMYFARLTADKYSQVIKMAFVK